MLFNPLHHHRKSIRLAGYDYAQTGLYFITLCTHNRQCLFGNVMNKCMILNDAGQAAWDCWLAIPQHFPHAALHEFVIKPNHVHGIIELSTIGANNHLPENNSFENNDMLNNDSPMDDNEANITFPMFSNRANIDSPRQEFRSPSQTIGSIIRGFKIGVTKWFRTNMEHHTVWQRNYYEHIIRNHVAYTRIALYIENNPANWEKDGFSAG